MTCEYCWGEEYPGCIICCPENYEDRSSRLHLMRHAGSVEDYAIALQQAIEYAVRGELIPHVIVDQCPHHGHTLNSQTLRRRDHAA